MTQDDRAMRETSTRETTTGSTRDMSFGLEEALDGELPRETVERMRRHTDDCPECADEWERLRRLKELVRRSCADRAPSDLRARIADTCRTITVTTTSTSTTTGADGSTVRVTRSTTTRRTLPPA
ncbi:mycothiol system anti-sigma-R factor [Brachybacterium paraconglomeratum]|uniref:mycothiol system anti-sigma-R factor n=1 Tax=Brachybacterium paraconglomeratum TaxID=173362 RepID=UPI0021A364F7|nr:mycothiol system anti-sigma-R factor [Brachybacterium paraconglomeratum]MCT1910314.1 mycothiol system anti-sigma-R factor [Brachybacterium paraconglomeratum]